MVFIYSKSNSLRIRFIFGVIFENILKTPYHLVHEFDTFLSIDHPKFTYAEKAIDGIPNLFNSGFLDQTGTAVVNPKVKGQGEKAYFFEAPDHQHLMPFDLPALAFYLVTRYEEYAGATRDAHDRFPAKASLAWKHDFLDYPIVDLWSIEFSRQLKKVYPNMGFPLPEYRFQPTYDIDYAWAYLHRGPVRTTGAIIKDLLKWNTKGINQRIKVLTKGQKDPYFTFETIFELHKESAVDPIFFFLIGPYGKHDKNISIKRPPFRYLIAAIAQDYTVGIHPSYRSHLNFTQVEKEIQCLGMVTGQQVLKSRQHYLRVSLPQTYQLLLRAGIKEDYSMGYAELPGFRAGIARPFPWFDLEANQPTALQIHPFQIMDVTMNTYMGLTPGKAVELSNTIVQRVKAVHGQLVTIWHNNSLSYSGMWKGWDHFYPEVLKIGQP